MSNPQIQTDPLYDLSLLGVRGLEISNDATTPNSIINIAAGICVDSNNLVNLSIGTAYPNYVGSTVAAPVSVDSSLSGAGGLDTGAVAASTVYAVYVIGDSHYYKPVSALISASLTAPLLPSGYDSMRLIGYAVTDSSKHFLPMYVYGNGSWRNLWFDAPQATAITAGAATSYTAIDLSALVPAVANLPVSIYYAFTPNTAGNALSLQGVSATGAQATITGQVSTVVISGNAVVPAQIASSKPEINYKVANSSDAVAIDVAGFMFSV